MDSPFAAAAGLALGWLLGQRSCPICGRPPQPPPHTPGICAGCRRRLGIEGGGRRGLTPLPWWAAGSYAGTLRQTLLDLRRHPRSRVLTALAEAIGPAAAAPGERPLLVAIPSWKRHGNPLPPRLCRELGQRLGLRQADLLERTRPVLGQHHLGRRLRQANQEGAFRCRRGPRGEERRRRPLLLVDDILTTGATACSAAGALEAAGWQVRGLLCLARTPPRSRGKDAGRDLRSAGRSGDGPG